MNSIEFSGRRWAIGGESVNDSPIANSNATRSSSIVAQVVALACELLPGFSGLAYSTEQRLMMLDLHRHRFTRMQLNSTEFN
jgi:hypothetical protein